VRPFVVRVVQLKDVLRHFPQVSAVVSGSFAERDVQLEALYESSQPYCSICMGHFPQMSPIIGGSFAERAPAT